MVEAAAGKVELLDELELNERLELLELPILEEELEEDFEELEELEAPLNLAFISSVLIPPGAVSTAPTYKLVFKVELNCPD
ncbi:MAG TPA: hypothetical protein ENH41_03540 [Candidatus Omnitrophica bacterium]|nr:hypothetical protein [Candidatus Omnitrophota bacterium]